MLQTRLKKLSMSLMLLCPFVFFFAALEMTHKREPFYSWFYCFAWWSYILFVQAILYHRRGRSLLFCDPGRFLLHLPLSVSVWLVFEAYNFQLHNWHYLNLPSHMGTRWFGYVISFATVLPGVFSTAELIGNARAMETDGCAPSSDPHRLHKPFFVVGILFCILPLLWPLYFFPLVWLGFILLLEPVNHRYGGISLIRDWGKGSFSKTFVLLASGALCGFLWELWNFWAGSKWVYTIPYFASFRVFEMPIAGFLGFPPFAVECYVMTNSFWLFNKWLKEKSAHGRKWLFPVLLAVAMVSFDLLVFWGIDHFTVVSFQE